MSDTLLDNTDDLIFQNGDFKIGESTIQEVGIILRLTKGDLKSDPLLGADLIQLKKTKVKRFDIESRARIGLGRDGKDFDEMKQFINVSR